MAYYKTGGIEVGDVTITIETEGPEEKAEKVHMHTHDEAVRAAQVFVNRCTPPENDGIGVRIDWDGVLAGAYPKTD